MLGLLRRLAQPALWVVSGFYAYGALVHVLNILSLTGFSWPEAPLRWQALDVIYLVLDAVVCGGLWRRWEPAVIAFYVAGVSQIVLYTVLRGWILDVPPELLPSPEQGGYLDGLVVFHVVTLVLVTWALRAET